MRALVLPSLAEVDGELERRGLAWLKQQTPGGPALPQVGRLARRLEPRLREQFLAAVHQILGQISVPDLERAVARRNFAALEDALGVAEWNTAWGPHLREILSKAFLVGAAVGADGLRRAGIGIRFDYMNPHAAQWAQAHAALRVTEVSVDQKASIRALIEAAVSDGRTVSETALDLVGRINRATGRREGGVVGLRSDQVRAAERYRAQLAEDGVDSEIAGRRVRRYEAGLLRQRGDLIARTEIITSGNAGQQGLWQEAKAQGAIDAQRASREWIVTDDDLLDKDICLPMDGVTVGLDEPWTLPNGIQVMWPGQEAHPNCRCSMGLVFDKEQPAGVPVEEPPAPEAVPVPSVPEPPPEPEPIPSSGSRQTLRDSPPDEIKRLGGGVNQTYKVRLKSGDLAVFKPERGEFTDAPGFPEGGLWRREVAASEVAAIMGLDDLIPATIERTMPRRGIGSLQAWRSGELGYEADRETLAKIPEEDLQRAFTFDVVMGNVDRHGKNWLVDESGKMSLIDHGFTLAESKRRLRLGIKPRELTAAIPDDLVQSWLANWDRVVELLRARGISEEAINRATVRLGQLQDAPSFGGLIEMLGY